MIGGFRNLDASDPERQRAILRWGMAVDAADLIGGLLSWRHLTWKGRVTVIGGAKAALLVAGLLERDAMAISPEPAS